MGDLTERGLELVSEMRGAERAAEMRDEIDTGGFGSAMVALAVDFVFGSIWTRHRRVVCLCLFGDRSIGRIDEHGNTNGFGHLVMQKPQPLGYHFAAEIIDAGRVAAGPGKAGDKTKLDRTGSLPMPRTMGMVAVAALAASVASLLPHLHEIAGVRRHALAKAYAPGPKAAMKIKPPDMATFFMN